MINFIPMLLGPRQTAPGGPKISVDTMVKTEIFCPSQESNLCSPTRTASRSYWLTCPWVVREERNWRCLCTSKTDGAQNKSPNIICTSSRCSCKLLLRSLRGYSRSDTGYNTNAEVCRLCVHTSTIHGISVSYFFSSGARKVEFVQFYDWNLGRSTKKSRFHSWQERQKHPDRLWGPCSLLLNRHRRTFPWGKATEV
jgi:hypothetical protein